MWSGVYYNMCIWSQSVMNIMLFEPVTIVALLAEIWFWNVLCSEYQIMNSYLKLCFSPKIVYGFKSE